jgi:hypothetical protein
MQLRLEWTPVKLGVSALCVWLSELTLQEWGCFLCQFIVNLTAKLCFSENSELFQHVTNSVLKPVEVFDLLILFF